jgi:serine/threonine-protein phosphatase 2B catalytic subunit
VRLSPVPLVFSFSPLTDSSFPACREESESVSELKNISGTATLPYDQLANGADGIKESITSFGDARKSDIDNEHLPPDLIDPEDFDAAVAAANAQHGAQIPGEEGLDVFGEVISTGSVSTAPTSPDLPPGSPLGAVTGEKELPSPGSEKDSPFGSNSPSPLGSPTAGTTDSPFKRHHRRQSSLGTTRTSPSTRRRSLENTISMIREAMSKDDKSMGAFFSLSPFFWP